MLTLSAIRILRAPIHRPQFAPGDLVLATSERGTVVYGRVRWYVEKYGEWRVDYMLPSGGLFSGRFAESQLEHYRGEYQ